jgi:hypothetical protein
MKRCLVLLCLLAVARPVHAAERCTLQAAPAMSIDEAIDALGFSSISTNNFPGGAATPGPGLPGTASLESMMIEGLTNFVVKRARQEAIAFVLDQVQTRICTKAQVLFPLTCAQFQAAEDTDTSVIPGRALQDALVADLRAIPWHVADTIDATTTSTAADKKAALVLRAADDIVCGIEHRQSPLLLLASAIEKYGSEFGLDAKTAAVLQIITRLAASVSAAELEGWIREPDRLVASVRLTLRGVLITIIRSELENAAGQVAVVLPVNGLLIRDAYEIFVTALPAFREIGSTNEAIMVLRKQLAELKSRAASIAADADALIKDANTKIAAVVATMTDLANEVIGAIEDPVSAPTHLAAISRLTTNLSTQLKELEDAADKLKGTPEWAALKMLALKLRTSVIALQKTTWSESITEAESVYAKYVAPVVPHALATYVAIRSYRTATDDAARKASLREVLDASLGLAEQLVVPGLCGPEIEERRAAAAKAGGTPQVVTQDCKIGRIVTTAFAAARSFLAAEYTAALRHLILLVSLIGPAGKSDSFTELKRFGALFSEIATAKSADEIAASLETAAAPLGSWRLRRKKTTYGLSARVGIGGGYEHLTQYNPDGNNGGALGLYVPVLLDVWIANSCPVGFGLQILDLGAITSIGIKSGTDVKPDANFSDVVSPGVQISLGLGKSPFVLGVSASWTPSLREKTSIDSTTMMETTKSFDSWRYMLSFSVDVPIFMW